MRGVVIKILFVSLVLLPCVTAAQTVRAKRVEFALVSKIYIEADLPDTPQLKQLVPHLRSELSRRGFVVVEDRAEADAILGHEASVIITLHGDANDPPDRAVYDFRLLLPDGRLLWKTTIRFVSKSDWTENNKSGADKLGNRLISDWQKARKNARQ